MTSFYSIEELWEIGFKILGKDNVQISRKASIYGAENMEIGSHVRIDDYAILSGKIIIKDYVHVASGTYLYGGKEGIIMEDYSGISSHSSVYAASDDYLGNGMTNPMISEQYRSVTEKAVLIGKHVIIGSGSVLLPGVCLGEGSAIGAMSLVVKDTEKWMLYAGIPAKPLKNRKKLYEIEKAFRESQNA